VALLSLSVSSAAGTMVGREAQRSEVAARLVGHEDDIAPTPTVTPVGAASRDVRLAAEAHAAVAASTTFDVDLRTIVEHGPKP
jgi:hypothetical protein